MLLWSCQELFELAGAKVRGVKRLPQQGCNIAWEAFRLCAWRCLVVGRASVADKTQCFCNAVMFRLLLQCSLCCLLKIWPQKVGIERDEWFQVTADVLQNLCLPTGWRHMWLLLKISEYLQHEHFLRLLSQVQRFCHFYKLALIIFLLDFCWQQPIRLTGQDQGKQLDQGAGASWERGGRASAVAAARALIAIITIAEHAIMCQHMQMKN